MAAPFYLELIRKNGDEAITVNIAKETENDMLEALAQCVDLSVDEIRLVGFCPNDDIQAHLFRLLKPKSKLAIVAIADRALGQVLATDLKIQGFVDIMAAKDIATGERFVVCAKPDWGIGAAVAFTKSAITTSSAPSTAKWTMTADDLADGDLVDENELLNDGIDVTAASSSSSIGGGGCGPENANVVAGKKRACKNCSCGLAEIEASEAAATAANLPLQERIVKSSSCGSCSKGDAFRCAGCPFLGKPAFEPGQERLILSLGTDDI